MRILHTSDWHFGRSLHGADLSDAVDAFIDWLEGQLHEHDVDVLLISGDIFDRAVPPVREVRRLSDALSRLCQHATVIAMPGNHDSALRLGFAADLMQPQLRIVSPVSAIGTPIECVGNDGQRCLVYPIPYLEPDLVRQELGEGLAVLTSRSIPPASSSPTAVSPSALLSPGTASQGELPLNFPSTGQEGLPSGEEEGALAEGDGSAVPLVGRSHQAVMDAAMTLIRADRQKRLDSGDTAPAIVMVHAFITGATPSDSERDIRVGGVENVGAATFDGFDYIAAGHLHRPQDIQGSTSPIRYAGSPIAYSFSEAATPKLVTLVELGSDGVRSMKHLATPCLRPLSVIRDSFEAVLGEDYAALRSHFVSITVTDDARPPQMTTRVREVFPHALVVMHEGTYSPRASSAAAVREGRSAHDVAVDFFEEISGAALNDAERQLIDDLWTDLRIIERGDRASAPAGAPATEASMDSVSAHNTSIGGEVCI